MTDFGDLLEALLVCGAALAGTGLWYRAHRPKPGAVFTALREAVSKAGRPLESPAHLRAAREHARIRARKIAPPLLFAAGALCGAAWSSSAFAPTLGAGIIAASVGILITRPRRQRISPALTKEIEFHLPIVMERLVMAAEAGLDIIPALAAACESAARNGSAADPVSALLSQVLLRTESGVPLEESFRSVSEEVESAALKHAFVHLAVAHRQGGELVAPLRELSDATQLCYQEQIEEEIAKLPVRATMPLLCTFAGLIVIFITVPLIQVVQITSKSIPR